MTDAPGETLIWLHDDALGPGQPVVRAYPGAPRVYVFDPAVIEARRYGVKRLTFLAECALELGSRLRRGETVAQVLAAAAETGCRRVATLATPCPQLTELTARLAGAIAVERLAPDPFVVPPDAPDLRRFTRYWKTVEARAFRPTARQGRS